MLAEGVWDKSKGVSAMNRAVQNATVVKKPKTFWSLTSAECIVEMTAQFAQNNRRPLWSFNDVASSLKISL